MPTSGHKGCLNGNWTYFRCWVVRTTDAWWSSRAKADRRRLPWQNWLLKWLNTHRDGVTHHTNAHQSELRREITICVHVKIKGKWSLTFYSQHMLFCTSFSSRLDSGRYSHGSMGALLDKQYETMVGDSTQECACEGGPGEGTIHSDARHKTMSESTRTWASGYTDTVILDTTSVSPS